MAYIVTEPCVNCRYTDCVSVCPVDCFHQGPNCVVIDPEVCIDCAVCVDECPVDAIYEASSVPDHYQKYIALNAQLAKDWPLITEPAEPLPEAEKWAKVTAKGEHLEVA